MPAFERVAVLGLGLLGGSVALAARRRGAATRVVGAARRPETLADAIACGAIDEGCDFIEAVRGSDLVILATPVLAMAELLREVAPALRRDAIVTDVGSVKGLLADTLPGLLPRGVAYVGSHPMAGSHVRGIGHAREDLFDGAPCIVTSAAADAGKASPGERVAEFWRALGARVIVRRPTDHDTEVAWMSHLPHIVAFAYAGALASAPAAAGEVVGSGFADFTRIGRSDPELWSEILTANRKSLSLPIQRMSEALGELGRVIEANDADGVERWVARAQESLSIVSEAETRSDESKKQGTAAPTEAGRERS